MLTRMRFHAPLLVCCALTVLSADVGAAQSALRLEGTWEGALAAERTSGSRELGRRTPPPTPVIVIISPASDGTYSGKWWVNSGAKGPADIGEVGIDGDAVRIGVPDSRGVWEGKLSPDGVTLAGEWRQSGKTTPLVLQRTGNSNDPARTGRFSPGTVTTR
jgi:hypothetical protein